MGIGDNTVRSGGERMVEVFDCGICLEMMKSVDVGVSGVSAEIAQSRMCFPKARFRESSIPFQLPMLPMACPQ